MKLIILTSIISLCLFLTQLFAAPNIDSFDKQVSAINSYFETQKLIANDGNKDDAFGLSLSIYGDWAMIGASRKDSRNKLGFVYVYKFNGIQWIQTQKLYSSDPNGVFFGHSISIYGKRVLISENRNNTNGDFSGAAYIFEFDGIQWHEKQKLIASDNASGDQFGYSVSIHGNYALIGAPYEDHPLFPNSGSAYIFEYDGSKWNEIKKLIASDGREFDFFGFSVSLSGNKALIGAWGNDRIFANEAGAAYLFEYDGSTWNETQIFISSSEFSSEKSGYSVSISDDRFIIGAKGAEQFNKPSSGASYVYNFDGLNWNETKLIASDSLADDEFGSSVSLFDNRVLIGTPRYYNDIVSGSAYLFELNGTEWEEIQNLTASDEDPAGSFGVSVGLSDKHVLIGNPLYDSIRGSAYIFEIDIVFSNGFE